ncbi:unnamed protein product [Microthlaspi erraticum]|uniref:Arabidopsis retrotransposon Orf1 C-terminal domain-containing protein n=1 Tax=Microthlaspi erraticum TaxID=1685480 RepID=A0A6D2JGM3_9BRAS|nr:unnamed protein product [Microthlaspi erraticum]
MALQMRRSEETESDEEGEEVNQLVDEDDQEGNQDEPMEEAEEEQEEDELPMYQEHYNALFSMDFVETKYPHDDTMRLGSLRMWSWCSRTCNWPSSSLTAWSLTRSSLEEELQRVGLQSLRGTLPQGPRLPDQEVPVLRYVHKALANTFFARKATGTINEGEVKLLDMGIKPIISRTRMGRRIRGDRHTQGTHASP